ncbi:nucleoside hydrolase [Microbacterium sp.]|uniref:nucleoside hydrolase n=1 Tax=Microbacterium sp. TaxID=51671 RepID=UPI00262A3C44|nr:nucleoside hydrolase [Microbacterium sp.]
MFLIDTDPGLDDAHAIAMAAHRIPADELVITTSFGNVDLETTTENARWLLGTMSPDAPIYRGCAGPLLGAREAATHIHGEDGLGGCPRDGGPLSPVSEGHAAVKIVEFAREFGSDLTIVALGPLTNLAVARQLEPDLDSMVGRVVVMGGSPAGFGNASVNAEFNFFADPAAAEIVLGAFSNLSLITWDVCLQNRFSESEMRDFWRGDSATSAQLRLIMEHRLRTDSDYAASVDYGRADPLAMAVALDPDCVTRAETHPITVGYDNGVAHGASIVDWADTLTSRRSITLPLEFDRPALLDLMTV